MPYIIIEAANTHGGNIDYLHRLIDEFSVYTTGYGMKFQPLQQDEIATPDFQWYSVYQKLFFDPAQWKDIIQKTKKHKDVWLDIFDLYGVQILKENINEVFGIKLQVSVLYNLSVLQALSDIDLSRQKLIVNVASLEIQKIDELLLQLSTTINAEEILLEVGFQGYPTQLTDSGISKIQKVKELFKKRIVFADHIDRNNEYALWLPVLAQANGADIIEKHVLLEGEKTEYDHYSSLNKSQFDRMVQLIEDYTVLVTAPFINQQEKDYLTKSMMKPLLTDDKAKGQGISLADDLQYKRSGKEGLDTFSLRELLASFHILAVNKRQNETLQKADFKKAVIAVIVAGRLKSSRLKDKALLKIGDLTSIETCLKNACRFSNINYVILATSDLESDAPLADYTYNDAVFFHRGHPDDVIQRYLDIIRKLKIDVIIRVTADMPFIDNDICQLLLKSHFETGADYTAANEAAVGTNLEIINAQALEKVKSYFPSAEYSEYMTWYFMNNEEHFNINLIDLPGELVRNYRLTLDYDDDLTMFNSLHQKLLDKNDYNLRDIYDILDKHPEIAKLNAHLTLKYKTDQTLINILNEKTKINQ